MRRFDAVAVGFFIAAAVVALLIGVGAIVYTYAVIEPKLTRINEQVIASIQLAERGLRVIDRHEGTVGALQAPQQSALTTTRAMPEVLAQTAYLSQHAARTLTQSAQTLRSVEESTGLVLPDDAFGRNAEAMATTARSLEGLAPMLARLHEAADSLANDLTQASARAEKLRRALQQADVTLAQVHAQLRQTRNMLQAAHLPAEITRLTVLHGALFIVLAVLLMGMAGIWNRLSQSPLDGIQRSGG